MLKSRFKEQLGKSGVFVDDLQRLLWQTDPQKTVKVISEWAGTDFSDSDIHQGLWSYQKDVIAPFVASQIYTILLPWIQARTAEFLPTISLKEVGRMAQMHPRKVYKIINKSNMEFRVAKQDVVPVLSKPDFSEQGSERFTQRDLSRRDRAYYDVTINLTAKNKQ